MAPRAEADPAGGCGGPYNHPACARLPSGHERAHSTTRSPIPAIPPLPVELERGELLLRTFVPTLPNRVSCTIAAARLQAFVVLFVTLFFALVGTALTAALFGEIAILVGMLALPVTMAAFTLPFAFHFIWAPPRKWWVTTRRLIVARSGELQTFQLNELSHIKAHAAHQVSVTAAGQRLQLSPLFAVAELWGAVVTGKTLASVSFPDIDTTAEQPTITQTICWHAQVFGPVGTRIQGVAVIRPSGITWIPFSRGWVGDRAMHMLSKMSGILFGVSATDITPIPPIDALFHQLLRCRSLPAFETVIEAVADAMNGHRFAPGTGRLDNTDSTGTTLLLDVDGGELRVTGIHHPDWPAVRKKLGLRAS